MNKDVSQHMQDELTRAMLVERSCADECLRQGNLVGHVVSNIMAEYFIRERRAFCGTK